MITIDIISYSEAKKAQRMAGNVGDKQTILTDLKNKDIVHYDKDNDVFINVKNKAIVEQWKANYEYEEGELFLFDEMMWVARESHLSSNSSTPELDEANGLCYPLATESGLGNVIDLKYEILDDGGNIKIEWINPTSPTYESREVFYSTTVDITKMRYVDIIEAINNNEDIHLLTDELGTDQGNDDTITIENSELRKYYYVKAFIIHYIAEEDKEYPSSGRYLEIANRDIYPPAPPMNLVLSNVDGSNVKLVWQQPSDSDFLYTKIIRSQVKMPINPTDGTVIDVVGGNGEYIDTTAQVGVKYYYKLFSYDDSGKDGMSHGVEGNFSSDSSAEGIIEYIATLGYDINTNQRLEDAIGLKQSDFDDIYPYSDIARCVINSNGDIVYYLDDEDSSLQEDGMSDSKLDGTDGQIVVEIPEFYYSKSDGQFKVSKEEFDNSIKFDRTYIGFAESSEGEDSKLKSVANKEPIRLKSLTELRTMASNIGSGWQLADYETRDILKMLFTIEYGGLNSQTLIGDGIVNDTEVNNTGKTISLGNKTGIGQDGSVSYRGIENLWGNIDEIVEGLVVTDKSYYVANGNYGSFVDDTNTGTYVTTNVVPITSDGYISKLDISGNIVGSETIGNNIDFVGDHQYSHKTGEINIVASGGNYQDGEKAGLFRNHMGLNPFGKEVEMNVVAEFDKVYTGDTTKEQESFGFKHESNMTINVDEESKAGNYYSVQLPLFIDDEDFDSLIKIAVL